jgi:molybdate transport system ATP-binding protein
MPEQALINLEHVSFTRNDRPILQDITWQVLPGQHWAITGPNGSGKTLLMQVAQGRLPCSGGRVACAVPGQVAQVSFELQFQVVAREQDQEAARQFSGRDQITSVRQFLGELPPDDLLDTLRIRYLLDASLLALSNGEMRKLLIARALQGKPRILVLDEPFDGLDVDARRQLSETIGHLIASGTQVLLVTHHVDEIPAGITHLVHLENGQVIFAGERKKINTKEAKDGENRSSTVVPFVPVVFKRPANSDREPAIVMKDVTVAYGPRVILDRLNWSVSPGEHWAIAGPNGAGKSTLLRLISADHLQAYANEIYLFGRRRGTGETIWEIKQRMGVLSPEFQIGYREAITVRDAVLSGLFDSVGLYRRTTPEQERQADGLLAFLGLDGLSAENFVQLSYGEKRMALLARALVKSPELLLLDEPCQGLDPGNTRRLIDAVDAIARETGTQILYVSHRRDEFPKCITHLLEFVPVGVDEDGHPRYRTETYSL